MPDQQVAWWAIDSGTIRAGANNGANFKYTLRALTGEPDADALAELSTLVASGQPSEAAINAVLNKWFKPSTGYNKPPDRMEETKISVLEKNYKIDFDSSGMYIFRQGEGVQVSMSTDNSSAKLLYLVDLVEKILPLKKWGFTQNAKFAGSSSSKINIIAEGELLPYVIYNSEHCRVKFSFEYSGYGREPGLWILYGRLHAPDNDSLMKQNSEDCYCWHKFALALQYLDGKSPQQAADTQSEEPRGVQEFLRSEPSTKTIPQPEWTARLHAMVWTYYGSRFFQLFDLRYQEVWVEYVKFVKEYYDLIGRHPAHKPSQDRIC